MHKVSIAQSVVDRVIAKRREHVFEDIEPTRTALVVVDMTEEDHNASLCAFYLSFGDVMSTDAVTACLEANARKHQTAAE